MFDISFTGEAVDADDGIRYLCVITLGDITEGPAVSLSLWSQADYQRQWLEGARRLLEPDSCSAFIVDVSDPPTACVVEWWPAWRVNDLIVLQRQLLFVGAKEGDELYNAQAAKFALEDPYAAIPDREEGHTEACRKTGVCRRLATEPESADDNVEYCVSEWWVSIEEMKEFVERRTRDWMHR